MENQLEEVVRVLTELNANNSSNAKKEILQTNRKLVGLTEVLFHTYNHYQKYGVHSHQLAKHEGDFVDVEGEITNSPWAIFTLLKNRKYTGHEAVRACNFAKKFWKFPYVEYAKMNLFDLILDRDLKCKVSVGIINKIFPKLIPVFDVALAATWDKKDVNYPVFLQRKLDGIRSIFIVDPENNEVEVLSRNGKPITTCKPIEEALLNGARELGTFEKFVIDGELCIVDENGNEDFQSILKEYRRKDYTSHNAKLVAFDFLDFQDFSNGSSDDRYSYRYDLLSAFVAKCDKNKVGLVRSEFYDEGMTKEELNSLLVEAETRGEEGFIIKPDAFYAAGRTANQIKVKSFVDEEFIVVSARNGEIDDGKGQKVFGLSAIEIQYENTTVGVGSGFSFEQRIEFGNNHELIIGKKITVKYFEKTIDEHGKPSLRFPVFKGIRED